MFIISDKRLLFGRRKSVKESEKQLKAGQIKEKIRERYKGVDPDEIRIILAAPEEDIYNSSSTKRVAVYARVSTDDPNQTSSYELQKNHYYDYVAQIPNWVLVKIYADEGISGTSLQHRKAFKEMIDDCIMGKIDIIVTKSVSRFARNTEDCLHYVRQLKTLDPPVGIRFETEGIFTLNNDAEMMLSFMATMAQEESHNKSEVMNASIEMRFRRGIFLTPTLLGYKHDEDGNLIINQKEAPIVKLIFFMYLYGYSFKEIAETLTRLSCSTKKGSAQWSPSTIRAVLQNERHCGDIYARKTYTPNFLDHKSKKNNHKRNKYYQKDHHEPIISHADFNAVQKKIRNAKFATVSFLPSLNVIKYGILKGFVSIHPHWAGFSPNDYLQASASVYQLSEVHKEEQYSYQAQQGEFDLRGYEVIRGQYFSQRNSLTVRINHNSINFGVGALRKLETDYIELLIHPTLRLLAVRPATQNNKHAVLWKNLLRETPTSRVITGSSFLPSIFSLLEWKASNSYKIYGIKKEKNLDVFLLFHLDAAEISISQSDKEKFADNRFPCNALVYPDGWGYHFGEEYYVQREKSKLYKENESDWQSQIQGICYDVEDVTEITSLEKIEHTINELINHFSKETMHG